MDLAYFCVTWIPMLIFLLYIVHPDRKKCWTRGGFHGDIFNRVLVEMETDPSAPPSLRLRHYFFFFPSFFFFFFSILTRSLQHSHSRKNPIIEISGPCWKRDSLWNVFGVKQRQCLSCPSANRMLCAGERREIRTDNGVREKTEKVTTKGGGGQHEENYDDAGMI